MSSGCEVSRGLLGEFVDILAISCDSFKEDTNIKIGRGGGNHIQQLLGLRASERIAQHSELQLERSWKVASNLEFGSLAFRFQNLPFLSPNLKASLDLRPAFPNYILPARSCHVVTTKHSAGHQVGVDSRLVRSSGHQV